MSKKTVQIETLSQLCVWGDRLVSSDDFLIKIKNKRKRRFFHPGIHNVAGLVEDQKEFIAKYCQSYSDEEKEEESLLKRKIELEEEIMNGAFCAADNISSNTCNIFVKGRFNRKNAEKAMAWFLRKRGIVSPRVELRFRWKKSDVFTAC